MKNNIAINSIMRDGKIPQPPSTKNNQSPSRKFHRLKITDSHISKKHQIISSNDKTICIEPHYPTLKTTIHKKPVICKNHSLTIMPRIKETVNIHKMNIGLNMGSKKFIYPKRDISVQKNKNIEREQHCKLTNFNQPQKRTCKRNNLESSNSLKAKAPTEIDHRSLEKHLLTDNSTLNDINSSVLSEHLYEELDFDKSSNINSFNSNETQYEEMSDRTFPTTQLDHSEEHIYEIIYDIKSKRPVDISSVKTKGTCKPFIKLPPIPHAYEIPCSRNVKKEISRHKNVFYSKKQGKDFKTKNVYENVSIYNLPTKSPHIVFKNDSKCYADLPKLPIQNKTKSIKEAGPRLEGLVKPRELLEDLYLQQKPLEESLFMPMPPSQAKPQKKSFFRLKYTKQINS